MSPCPHPRGRRVPAHAVAVSALAATLALSAAHPAHANGVLNVSELVLGVAQPTPAAGAAQACGSACRYSTGSGAQMGGSYMTWPGAYITAAWPIAFGLGKQAFGAVDDTAAVPMAEPGTVYDTLPGGALQRAQVVFSDSASMPASERQLDVRTWRSGSGAAAVSYAVRIDTPAGPARPTFLRFGVPTQVRAVKQAGYFNGNQPVTERPLRYQARSAVDVYVDGLPVWSAQSTRLVPKRFDPDVAETLAVDSGPPLAGGEVTLFLGSLPGGSSRTAVIVMRSDLRVDSPTCHTVPNTLGNDWRRCETRIEGLALPSISAAPLYLHQPHVTVWTQ